MLRHDATEAGVPLFSRTCRCSGVKLRTRRGVVLRPCAACGTCGGNCENVTVDGVGGSSDMAERSVIEYAGQIQVRLVFVVHS